MVKRETVQEQLVKTGAKAAVAARAVNEPSDYGKAVAAKVRERYSINDEESIKRKAIAKIIEVLNLDAEEFEEFLNFHAYIEQCKAEIQAEQNEHNQE